MENKDLKEKISNLEEKNKKLDDAVFQLENIIRKQKSKLDILEKKMEEDKKTILSLENEITKLK